MQIEDYLSGFVKFTNTPSLKGMEWLMNEFGNPQKNLKVIHVAGTNGKGSVCEMITNVLIQAGYRVGKFISPHLITFHETICVNNQPILDKEVQEVLQPLSDKIETYNQTHEVGITWFEVITSLALIYLGKKDCDFVVLETGMGGTYDCTNIADGMISILTSIGMDHTDVLGDTIEKIAINKAGIIKKAGHTIFIRQQKEVNDIIEKTCKEQNNTLHLLDTNQITNYSYNTEYQYFDTKSYLRIEVNLKGKKQVENAMLCMECIDILRKKGYPISEQAMRHGLKTVVHPARFETLCDNPTIIFDGGHNQKAIDNFKKTIAQYDKGSKKVYIISILTTKDYRAILKQLVDDEDAIYFFTDGNDKKRYVAKEELEKEARKQAKGILKIASLEEAITIAKKEYADATIYIVGSFYVYQTVLEILEK